MKNYTTTQKILISLFTILYCCVGFVSLYHAIDFFGLSNANWLATILACAFEIGQAAVLFALLTQQEKKVMPWVLMIILTAVQCMGNIFASFKYMIVHNADQLHFFTDSILFFVKNPNPLYNQVMISYITGAILPIVALCMTGMVVSLINSKKETEVIEKEVIKEAPKEVIKEVPKVMSKKVIKEVPKEVVKEVIKEVPKEVIKEVPAKQQDSYSERKPVHIDNIEDSTNYVI